MLRAVVLLATLTGCDQIFGLDQVAPDAPAPAVVWTLSDSGLWNTCALRSDGALYCWGGNTQGEGGVGEELPDLDRPQRLDGTWRTVSAAFWHVCGVQIDDTLWCWGLNGSGQLGIDSTTNVRIPKQVAGTWASVSVGIVHTCAIDLDGHAWCWGAGGNGRLGDGGLQDRSTPVQIDDARWKLLAPGNAHTCGLHDDGTLWCWGLNRDVNPGDGDGSTLVLGDARDSSTTPVQIGTDTWTSLGMLATGTCGITTAGQLRCWGQNKLGELGLGEQRQITTPTPVLVDGADAADWTGLATSNLVGCGLRADHSAWCWGSGDHGQTLRDELVTKVPTRVASDRSWTRVSVGLANACLTDDAGALWCGGANGHSQLADGGASPRQPAHVGTWSTIDAGNAVTCATQAGTLACAGTNVNLQIATTEGFAYKALRPVPGDFTAVAGGARHQCGLDATGNVRCWGIDENGELGDGTGTSSATPTLVTPPAVLTYSQVDAGARHTCAITPVSNGKIQCWGRGAEGQLGDGTSMERSTPVTISTNYDWQKVSAGGAHTCAIAKNTGNLVYCWGSAERGQLGSGTESRVNPMQVNAVMPPAVDISTSDTHTCAVTEDGAIWCWGANDSGQLGYDTSLFGQATVPNKLAEAGFSRVAAGSAFTCAVKTNGSMWCWGRNTRGQLGSNSLLDRRTPAEVAGGGAAWTSVTAGSEHACGTRVDGTAWCWGNNDDGQTATDDAWSTTLVEISAP